MLCRLETMRMMSVILVAGLLCCATIAVDGFSRVIQGRTHRPANSRCDLDDHHIVTKKRGTLSSHYASKTSGVKAVINNNKINNNAKQDDDDYVPFKGKQPQEALSEIFIPHVMSHHSPTTGLINSHNPQDIVNDDDLLWVPQTETVSFRPLCLCVSGGYYVNLLRVLGSGLLSRHRHPGPVHGHVLKGRWRYLEHDWEAVEGSYIFEPPGETHTLVVPDGVEEMITLFHVTGSLLYCDPDGTVVGADDVFTKLELAKRHYMKVGLGEDFVQQFVR